YSFWYNSKWQSNMLSLELKTVAWHGITWSVRFWIKFNFLVTCVLPLLFFLVLTLLCFIYNEDLKVFHPSMWVYQILCEVPFFGLSSLCHWQTDACSHAGFQTHLCRSFSMHRSLIYDGSSFDSDEDIKQKIMPSFSPVSSATRSFARDQ
ncbi:hypothetical protein H5410_008581, partial [Solanum commersonii]